METRLPKAAKGYVLRSQIVFSLIATCEKKANGSAPENSRRWSSLFIITRSRHARQSWQPRRGGEEKPQGVPSPPGPSRNLSAKVTATPQLSILTLSPQASAWQRDAPVDHLE